MRKDEKFYFDLLKKEVTATFSKNHRIFIDIKDWKGSEIVLFQEDLFAMAKASVSEKWFYTYFKNNTGKLPRIDMLNLLSNYVGYKSWNAFKGENANPKKSSLSLVSLTYLLLGACLVFAVIWLIWSRKNEFHFCFVDQITDQSIVDIPLDIKIISEKGSPMVFKTDSLGCFSYKTKEEYIKFIVKSPYHKTDTITRFIDSKPNKAIRVSSDDYALMLSYYTSGNVKDWKIHRRKLSNIISEDALIYQLYNTNIGVEIHTKDEFIRMLTIPTSSLKGIKILDKQLENGKIVTLKFTVL
ncbi:hypothetical protein [Flagellimonas sp. 2504JD4-2]